ncbi:TIGR03087 family PEP-CTERM/XrtA system glycosyltransferase [Sphingomonas mucosissima]|uniref:Glycosyl transferases group 1 n=1 Tax=Sphingomonas mucosissima TaxID=370959 RepID=A0A245ZR22_9SPHN|nr:TIGR03087 family PEP-CTERM/XrtA system glycosyltransferase [Sphingomonas mucosissima]OWK32193.1 glycosyl transferases group 1 [Sphingomonas mucosissima]
MDILFLAHRAPFPPDRGDRIRSFNILKYLSQRARVHLVAFVDDDAVITDEHRALVDECVLIRRTKSQLRAVAEALAKQRPVSLTAFADREFGRAVKDIVARRRIDAVYAFSGQMAQYIPDAGPIAIMDFVDLDSAKFAAYAQDARAPMRWMMRREARLLARYEQAVAARVSASLFVSAAEAALLPGSRALENGIDTVFYDPALAVPVASRHPLIVFTGQMDYRPNVDAVSWFARSVLPLIPDARFAIVGRAPTAAVRALAAANVTVTGEVADVRGWLAAADVVVAPLQLARGVQNKVLEAMAMARPVVASAGAAEGVDHAGTIHIASDARDYADRVTALIRDPSGAAALGRAAREQVIARYGWEARLAPLNDLLGLAGAGRVG